MTITSSRPTVARPVELPMGAARRSRADRMLTPAVDVCMLALFWAVLPTHNAASVLYVLVAAVLVGLEVGHGRIHPQLSEDAGRLVARLAVPLLVIGPLFGRDAAGRLLEWAPIAVILVLAGRALSYAVGRRARRRGEVAERTVIVGAGTQGVQLAATLREHPEFGLSPIGFLDRVDDSDLPLPLLGDASDLDAVIEEFDVARVIIAFGVVRDPVMVRVMRTCEDANVQVHVMPRFFELGIAHADRWTDDIWGIPLVAVRRAALAQRSRILKRALDIAVAGPMVVLGSPVLLSLALAVRLTSRGPILFRQKRVGQGGRIVEVLKFRTMQVNNDSDTRWCVEKCDDQMTPIGGLLRRTSLDELPQLLNVLRGDMSLVGPRPERPYFVSRFSTSVADYGDRHRLPVGVTGWAQIHGLRGDSSIEERSRFDNQYIENWSIGRDLMILVRTAAAVIRDALT